jgi:hypothetical protein
MNKEEQKQIPCLVWNISNKGNIANASIRKTPTTANKTRERVSDHPNEHKKQL